MIATTVIETEKLTKVYNGETAVSDVSFHVKEGEIFGFLGPNGAGKTTTLLMLLGLTEPTSGRARVLDMDPVKNPIAVKRRIGYLQENMGFYRDLNAFQSLQFIAELNGMYGDAATEQIEKVLETVGLADQGDKKVEAYSRGMRQRLGIAEVLIKSPRIVFLDEPTLGLDPESAIRMIDLIERLSRKNNMTVLLSSHLLHQVQKICDRIGIMINGEIVAQGTLANLAKEKLGIGKQTYTLEEIYMKYFQEA